VETVPSVVVDVSVILEETGGSLDARGEFAIDVLAVGPVTFETASPVRYNVTLTNAGEGILAMGEVRMEATTACSRCLKRYPQELAGRIERLYVREEPLGSEGEDQDVEAFDGTTVDLGPALAGSLAAEAPYVPLCAEACSGLCPVCGADLNETDCTCEPERVASPFAGLDRLLDETSEDDGD
jgi:uncharacterized protein